MKLFFLLPLLIATSLFAADWYVDNVSGDDDHSGTIPNDALATIALAISKAQPGDTIHLAAHAEPYRDSANFYGHPGGEPGKPITLNGNGAILRGTDICSPDGWKPSLDNGTVQRSDLVSRLFLLVDGKMEPRFAVMACR